MKNNRAHEEKDMSITEAIARAQANDGLITPEFLWNKILSELKFLCFKELVFKKFMQK